MAPSLRRATALLAALCIFGPTGVSAAETARISATLSKAQKRELKRGEVVTEIRLEQDPKGNALARVRGVILIDKPWREVWNCLTDYDRQFEFMPRLEQSKIMRQEGPAKWVFHHVEVFVLDIDYTLKQTLRLEERRIDFALDHSVKNGIAETNGAWRFEPVARGKKALVSFSTFVDSGMPVPQFIQNWLTERDLPEMLDNLRKRTMTECRWKKGDDYREPRKKRR